MTIDGTTADAQLAEARRLGAATRRDTTWYIRWLLVYGVASLGLGAVYGLVAGPTATWIAMPAWGLLVAGLSWWASTRRTTIRGFGALHSTVIVVWSLLWLATVTLGTGPFDTPVWWFSGGVLMAATAFTGAAVARRRRRA